MLHLTEPNFEDLIQNHVHCLTTEGRSQKTIGWYTSNLKRFSRFLKSRNMPQSVTDIGISEVRIFIHHLQSEVVDLYFITPTYYPFVQLKSLCSLKLTIFVHNSPHLPSPPRMNPQLRAIIYGMGLKKGGKDNEKRNGWLPELDSNQQPSG